MKKYVKTSKFWLCIALVLCLISMIGSAAAQTSCGNVHVQKVEWVGKAGNTVAGKLYVPDTASTDHPAPAIVTVHGWYNNREMQDGYATEFARRGYVVMSVDMYGHGDSEWKTWEDLYVDGCGEYSAVQFIADLPYVDAAKIGVTGHSSGGDMMAQAVAIDNEQETQLISACLFQASYLSDDTGVNHAGDFGSRDVGIIADTYDEFFYVTTNESTGTEDSVAGEVNQAAQTNPARDFLKSNDAKNFLNWNEGSDGFAGEVVDGQFYVRNVNGVDSYRVIYNPTMTHPHVAFSGECIGDAVEFFQKSLGAPNPLASSNQRWKVKTAFNLVGLLAFLSLFALIPLVLVDTKLFESLKAKDPVTALDMPNKKTKAWFWLSLAACALFGYFTYPAILGAITQKPTIVSFWPQTASLAQGTWAVCCGLFSALVMFLFYKFVGKGNGMDLRARGIIQTKQNVGKTILLAAVTLVLGFSVLWIADYFFLTDFRYYILTFRVFKANTLGLIFRFFLLFGVFYIINSISTNAFNYTKIDKKGKDWVNMLVVCLANAIGILVYLVLQYSVQRQTGTLLYHSNLGECISGIWAYPTAFLLLVTPLMSRAVYKKTANPYIAGIINGFVVTAFVVCQSTTVIGS